MRKGYKLASLVGAVMLASGAAQAGTLQDALGSGTPMFEDLMNEDGSVKQSSYCVSNPESCQVIASGDGFMQVMIGGVAGGLPNTDGETYIMTFIGDNNGFSDQSYVRMSTTNADGTINQENPGIVANQKIIELDNNRGGGFESNVLIATGSDWTDVADQDISITQNLSDLGGTMGTSTAAAGTVPGPTEVTDDGDNFFSDFTFKSVAADSANGVAGGYSLDLSQVAGLYAAGGSTDDKQTFAYRARKGDFVDTANAGIEIGGETVGWAAGDEIKATWMGQTIEIPDANDNVFMQSDFGYLSLQNVGDSTTTMGAESGFSSANASGPWNDLWDSEFGKTPCLADPTGENC